MMIDRLIVVRVALSLVAVSTLRVKHLQERQTVIRVDCGCLYITYADTSINYSCVPLVNPEAGKGLENRRTVQCSRMLFTKPPAPVCVEKKSEKGWEKGRACA